ncbi:hypothetical protein SAXI111661_06110 [Saccharomonospora xinjiangensis]|nr:hypothetical protein [Saccharomonospora xinjiangensis]QBQ58723.1 hypothetical protein EYD13_01680 [Saccharomonospora xinjiangensis]
MTRREKLPAVTDAADSDRLHQPWRLAVAAVEAVLALAAGWAATWCWRAAVTPVTVHADDGTELVSHVYDGSWVGLAFASAAVAGVLLVDGSRQTVLGVRTRRRRKRRPSRRPMTADTPADTR